MGCVGSHDNSVSGETIVSITAETNNAHYTAEQEGLTAVVPDRTWEAADNNKVRRNPLAQPDAVTPTKTEAPAVRSPEAPAPSSPLSRTGSRRSGTQGESQTRARSIRQRSRTRTDKTAARDLEDLIEVKRSHVHSTGSARPPQPPSSAHASPGTSLSTRSRHGSRSQIGEKNVAVITGWMDVLHSRMQSGSSRGGPSGMRGFAASGTSLLATSQSNFPGADNPFAIDVSVVSNANGAAPLSTGISFVQDDSLQLFPPCSKRQADELEDSAKSSSRRFIKYKQYTEPPTAGEWPAAIVTDKSGARVQSHLSTQSSVNAVTKWLDGCVQYHGVASPSDSEPPVLGPPSCLDPEFGDIVWPSRHRAALCGFFPSRPRATSSSSDPATSDFIAPPELLISDLALATQSEESTPSRVSRLPPRSHKSANRQCTSTTSPTNATGQPHELSQFPRHLNQSTDQFAGGESAFLASQSNAPSTVEPVKLQDRPVDSPRLADTRARWDDPRVRRSSNTLPPPSPAATDQPRELPFVAAAY